MKLWWPHNEAMIATLMAYEATGDETWWQRFEMVSRHCFKCRNLHFFRTPSLTATLPNLVSSALRWPPTPWSTFPMIDPTERCRRQ